MNRKLLAMALAAALTLAACGSDDKKSSDSGTPAATPTTDATAPADTTAPSGGASAGSDLKLSADPSGQLKFDTDTLDAKAGTVTITMSNPADVPHAIAVEGNGVDKDGETVQKGGTSTVTVKLKAGDYEFYCPVPGHKEGGMKGTLTVK
jgi:plastocyanin